MSAPHSAVEIDLMINSVEENMAANPGYAELCKKLGLLYSLKKHFQEARAQFEQCLVINPDDLDARVNLAFLSIRQGKWEEAEGVLRECIEMEPENSLCNHILGVVFLIRGDRVKATQRFERAAQLDPFYRLQYERFGALRGQRIELDGPSERKLIRNGENLYLANLHRFIGQCYSEMGEIAKAIREFRKVDRIHSADYTCHLDIGKLYDLKGDYRKAIEEFQEAAKIFPDCGMAYAHMSYAYAGIGDFEGALASLKKAVEIHPQNADLRYQLGLLYEDLEMCKEAIDEFTAVLEINPRYLFARISLGVLYEKTGQTDRAFEEYEKVAVLVTEDKDLVDRIDQIKRQAGSPAHDLSNRLDHPKAS